MIKKLPIEVRLMRIAKRHIKNSLLNVKQHKKIIFELLKKQKEEQTQNTFLIEGRKISKQLVPFLHPQPLTTKKNVEDFWMGILCFGNHMNITCDFAPLDGTPYNALSGVSICLLEPDLHFIFTYKEGEKKWIRLYPPEHIPQRMLENVLKKTRAYLIMKKGLRVRRPFILPFEAFS